ncbi:hypothetical protein Ac2012v2_007706 [Leucoagaricus gongylophorus]
MPLGVSMTWVLKLNNKGPRTKLEQVPLPLANLEKEPILQFIIQTIPKKLMWVRKKKSDGIPRHQMGTSLNTQTRNVSSYAGMDANNFLDDNDPEMFDNIGRSRGAQGGQPGEAREMGGYRATLKNPRVSEQAKQNAKDVLEEHNEPFSTQYY